ncbi:MAG: lysylphosphatidylglycerol synthase transmembrane domain-containing protein, partial [Bacteroidota bacterium]
MATSKQDILNQFKISRIIWPILIGLLVVGYMFVQDLRSDSTNIQEAIQAIDWKGQTFLWLGAALVMMVLRDVAYIWRMRLLTEKEMSWRACFEVTMLWEFASAATPSIVGGTAVAVFMFIKEKISAGKSAAIVFITIFLDEFYYLAILPIAIIFAGNSNMFATLQGTSGAGAVFGSSVIASFWIAYGAILAYVTFLALGLFVKPQAIHMLIKKLFLTKLLYRWRFGAFRTADDLLNASRQYRRKPFKFWLAAGVSTLLAWMSRYLVLNCILAAFATAALGLTDHVIIYARQAVLF